MLRLCAKLGSLHANLTPPSIYANIVSEWVGGPETGKVQKYAEVI